MRLITRKIHYLKRSSPSSLSHTHSLALTGECPQVINHGTQEAKCANLRNTDRNAATNERTKRKRGNGQTQTTPSPGDTLTTASQHTVQHPPAHIHARTRYLGGQGKNLPNLTGNVAEFGRVGRANKQINKLF